MASGTSSTCWDSHSAVFTTDLKLPGLRQGKVRDVYPLPNGPGGVARLAIIATDRLSAFDVVLPTPIPGKGRLLTSIAAFWFRWLEVQGLGPTHLLSVDERELPDEAFQGARITREDLAGRVTIARACEVLPIECVVRGYLEGSGWAEYQRDGSVCGVPLPRGLKQGDRLPEPIFTPATKAEQGAHDENISFDDACQRVGEAVMTEARRRSLAIYEAGAAYARSRGLLLADTKFEFGFVPGGEGDAAGLMLIDEVLTPDSSRYWPVEGWQPGGPQPSFDKQFVREFLLRLVEQGAWDKTAPGPALPEDVVRGTLERYRQAHEMLTSPKA